MRAISLLVVFALSPVATAQPPKPEPKYEGKPLTYWIERIQKAENEKDRYAAKEAIVAFGADAAPAVPKLIEMLDDRSPDFRSLVVHTLVELAPIVKDVTPALINQLKENLKATSGQRRAILLALSEIETEAKDVVPLFITALDDAECRVLALSALCKLGPAAKESVPAIRRVVAAALADPNGNVEDLLGCCHSLSNLGPDTVPLLCEMLDLPGGLGREYGFKGLKELGPAAKKAVPTVMTFLKHDDPEVRYKASLTLWMIEKNPAVVPVLASLLKEREASIVLKAAELLGDIGPEAKAALPALKAALSYKISDADVKQFRRPISAENDVHEAARQAIEMIEAEPKK